MSLYGALYSSVAGIASQSNRIGVISDNISNVNTVGYKRADAQFETLVTSSGLVSSYSPGGVLSINRQLISRQGLIQGSTSTTDIAISGNGFFVVNTLSDSTGNTLYTRAGSFTQDNVGNFINAAGFYLQGWPLDRDGNLPGVPGNPNTNSSNNLTSLETINVQQATGSAAATTKVTLSANLLGSQTIYPGADATATMDVNTDNFAQPGKSIIVPGSVNGLARGDKFTISTGGGLSYTYRYGGFTFGRDVTSGTNGDNGLDVYPPTLTLPNTPFTTTNGSDIITVSSPANGLSNGDVVTISGESTDVAGIPYTDFNQSFVIFNVTADSFQIQVAHEATSATTTGGDNGLSAQTRPFAGNLFDAQTASQAFLGLTGTSDFLPSALSFTITTEATGTVTFTYTSSTPNAQLGQFNTLNNLATAINSVSGLSARVVDGRLYVGAVDANAAVTFANGSATGSSGPPVKAGLNWIRELGLANIDIGDDRFNSLASLETMIDASAGLNATLNNTLTNATLDINVDDPLDTISFSDLPFPSDETYTAATPFTTVVNSNVVSVTSPSPNGFKNGDLVTLDTSSFAGYTPITINSTGSPTIAADGGVATSVVTFTLPSGPADMANGDIVYIDPTTLGGYPNGTINGIPITELAGPFVVANVNTTTHVFTITVPHASTATSYTVGTTSASESMTVSHTFNGIPIEDFTGTFEVTVTGPSTFTIELPVAASASGATGLTGLVVTPPTNNGSVLAELGLVDSLNGVALSVAGIQALGPIGPEYDPADSAKNMAGGNITPQYTQNLQIYDSLGTAHNLKVSFIKTAINTWAVELYAVDDSEVSSTFAEGLLAYGSLTFNGDGSLRSVGTSLASAINIPWTNGAVQSSITFNWGTAGEPFGTVGATQIGGTDGMTQFDAAYKINSINQNGAPVGQLTGVTVDKEGFVIANYNNGQTQKLYKIPIATFSDPDSLNAVTGNAFSQSNDSGQANLREAGTNGAGSIQPSALETSTVDLATELTDMIVAQRAYQANAKVISTSDDLLEVLNNTIR